ncbi:hypothetical protein EI42_00222 [Thermosporothrix hazakensis]|uniref:Uncharacterized protein n=1 Tax=Thermosporothrix hazakensis TaxID=644383 RepID=A0A326UBQ9_THEHA|nr:hypothetical protein EI42_00222 [Thermosporothrix hazakensis]
MGLEAKERTLFVQSVGLFRNVPRYRGQDIPEFWSYLEMRDYLSV